jgi:hypothetical protein
MLNETMIEIVHFVHFALAQLEPDPALVHSQVLGATPKIFEEDNRKRPTLLIV